MRNFATTKTYRSVRSAKRNTHAGTFFPFGKNILIDNATRFGATVASARKALGLTQRELALAINSGERFIVDLEAGKPRRITSGEELK